MRIFEGTHFNLDIVHMYLDMICINIQQLDRVS